MRMDALCFIHEPHEGLGLLHAALEAHGFRIQERVREVRAGDEHAPLVVVMGGPMGVYEAAQYPFLQAELTMLRQRLQARRPVLGICLGSQLLAAAAGSRVYRGTAGFELGVAPVSLTPEAQRDPVFHLLAGVPVAHWHGDTFDDVPGAQLLASSARYRQQAFALGSAYGLQFHPELDAVTFRSWSSGARADVERAGENPEAFADHGAHQLLAAQGTLERFLLLLVGRLKSAI